MFSELRCALRQLAKSPGFAAVAILSLALGIGANTAVFSLLNAVLLEMLPVKNPQQLVVFNWLGEENVGPRSLNGNLSPEPGTGKSTSTSFSIPTFEALQKSADSLADIFTFAPTGGLTINLDGSAEIAGGGQYVSGNYHRVLGVTAAAGRLLTPEDDQPSAEAVAVISYAYWQRRFGGDSAAIGKKVTIGGVPITLVGVTAPAFKGTMQVGEVVDVTLPLALNQRINRNADGDRHADYWWVRVMGRLKPGVTAEQTRAGLEGVFRETARGNVVVRTLPGAPAVDPAKVPLPQLRVAPGGQGLYESRRRYEQSLRLLMGIVLLVLLVACANVANLLLARGEARRREIAVRLALGASRVRLLCQLLAESVMLAALGTAAGLVFAIWGTRALVAMRPFGAGALELDTPLDWRVLGFSVALALATGVIFGLAPALRATRLNLTEEFQGGVRSLGAGSRSALAKSLMVVQVSLSLVLLVGAGLFVRTLRNLQHVDVGFNREHLLLFQLTAPTRGTLAPPMLATYERMRERIAALPFIRHATYARVAPLSQSNWGTGVNVPGYVQTNLNERGVAVNGVEAAYLATMEQPLLRGRDFTDRDSAGAPQVAIVNQSFAKKYFGTEDVIGRRFSRGQAGKPADIEIVGLVRDAKYADVKTPFRPTMYFPFPQFSPNEATAVTFIVRFTGGEAVVTDGIRTVVREIDASFPITNLRTQVQQIDRLFTQERLFANLCSFFGALALGLAAVGLYGLMSYQVLRRTGEIGLRMALGALPAQVLGMIVRESMGLVVLGVLLGIGAAWGATRWISSMLFGLSPTDELTYCAVAVLLITVALIACFLPACRASKVDPMLALRHG